MYLKQLNAMVTQLNIEDHITSKRLSFKIFMVVKISDTHAEIQDTISLHTNDRDGAKTKMQTLYSLIPFKLYHVPLS